MHEREDIDAMRPEPIDDAVVLEQQFAHIASGKFRHYSPALGQLVR